MHRLHRALTVVAPIIKGRSGDLSILLNTFKDDAGNCTIRFCDSNTTLFVSIVILQNQKYGKEDLPETLVFATTFSGLRITHLRDLVVTCKKQLISIFKFCEDFPKADLVKDDTLIYYLKSHHKSSAFNTRYNCITKKEVKQEKCLRNEIEGYLDRAQDLGAFTGLKAVQVKSLIQRHIITRGEKYEWSYKPSKPSLTESIIINRGPIILAILLGILIKLLSRKPRHIIDFFVIASIAYLVLISILKYISTQKTITASRQGDIKVRWQAASQIQPVLNEMTAIAPLKKGRIRRYFFSAALRVASLFAPFFMKIPTVSTIRWLTVNNRKRLLFLSSYSNTTDFYVRDFLNGSTPMGVNFMFTNGEGFPDARLLFYDGISKDPEGYMNAVHLGQQVTDLSYAHDPELTCDMINNNRKIRNGLFIHMSEERARQWLKLL